MLLESERVQSKRKAKNESEICKVSFSKRFLSGLTVIRGTTVRVGSTGGGVVVSLGVGSGAWHDEVRKG